MSDHLVNQGELLTYNELARILQLSLRTLRGYVMRDQIPYIKLGDWKVRFVRSEIAAWLEQQKRGAKV